MELEDSQKGLLPGYLASFDGLIGDKRTRVTFRETVKGVIGAGSLVCQRIAASSATLSAAKEGGQRVSRMATGESTKRSQIDAESVTGVLRERGIEHLCEVDTDELWLIGDGSDLRKPYAREMPDMMLVRDLDGNLVSGYRTLNVVGITPSRRGVLYHRLFSSKEDDFLSESLEAQQMLQTVSAALVAVKQRMTVSWILDSGFDDVAVWRTVWEQEEHLVCRVKHTERLVTYQNDAGQWVEGDIKQAQKQLKLLATAETEMVVRRGRQRHAKRQRVRVKIKACPIRLTYETNVRREGPGEKVQKNLWLVEVRLPATQLKPWLLITDWPVTDADAALRIFQMYRQRWAVEVVFTQMTKPHVLAAWVSGDHISDLDIAVGDHYPVDQQLHQSSFLLKGSIGQASLNAATEALDRCTQVSQLLLPAGLLAELLGLLFQPLVFSLQIGPPAPVFR